MDTQKGNHNWIRQVLSRAVLVHAYKQFNENWTQKKSWAWVDICVCKSMTRVCMSGC